MVLMYVCTLLETKWQMVFCQVPTLKADVRMTREEKKSSGLIFYSPMFFLPLEIFGDFSSWESLNCSYSEILKKVKMKFERLADAGWRSQQKQAGQVGEHGSKRNLSKPLELKEILGFWLLVEVDLGACKLLSLSLASTGALLHYHVPPLDQGSGKVTQDHHFSVNATESSSHNSAQVIH